MDTAHTAGCILAMAAAAAIQLNAQASDSPVMIYEVMCEPSIYGEAEIRYIDSNGAEIVTDETVMTAGKGPYAAEGAFPAAYDLREYGRIPAEIRDQADTGTCWAHSSLAAAESSLLTKGIETDIDLSEAHTVWFTQGESSCDENDPLYGDGTTFDLGTNCYNYGGNYKYAVSALGAWKGAVSESTAGHAVTDKAALDEALRYQSEYHLINSLLYSPEDRISIKRQIMEQGAVTLSYYSYNDSAGYLLTTGDFTSYYQDKKTSTNHAVTVIGWDDDFPAENFRVQPEGDGAWLIRNSWGEEWGTDGCFYLSYHDPSIGRISSFEMESRSNFGNVYQYDGIATSRISFPEKGIIGANLFTAARDEKLSAVSFHTLTADTPYQIDIYSHTSSAAPLEGVLLHSQSGSLDYAGYHTIPLDSIVGISEGTDFTVAVTLAAEGAAFQTDDFSAAKGVSFVMQYDTDGADITDISDVYNCNLCIKAFTEKYLAAPQGLTAQPHSGRAELSWDAVPDAEYYIIFRDNVKIAESALPRFTDTELTNGVTYTYRVTAAACRSTGEPSQTVDVTPVIQTIPPYSPKAEAGRGCVDISWDAVDGASAYRVRKLLDSGWSTIATTADTSYTDITAEYGVSRSYSIFARVNGQWSSGSRVVSAAPCDPAAAPENVAATASDGAVLIRWDEVAGASRYRIRRNIGSGWETIAATTATCYNDTGLTNGTRCTYGVFAYIGGAWGNASKLVSATPVSAAAPPEYISASAVDESSVLITWTTVKEASAYRVFRSDGGAWTQTAETTEQRYTDTDCGDSLRYDYRVSALVNGTWSAPSESVTVHFTAECTPPAQVTAAVCGNEVSLSWDAVARASAYRLRCNDGSGWKTILTTAERAFSITQEYGKEYQYSVFALVGEEWSAPSDIISCKAQEQTGYIEGETQLTVSVDGRIIYGWDIIQGAERYRVRRNDGGGWKTVATTSETVFVHSVTQSDTVHSYVLYAYIGGSFTPVSGILSARI